MRLDRRNERELARRKGFARRTILQLIWLFISAVLVYFLIQYLLDNNYLSYPMLYSRFLIPPGVPQWAVMAGLILLGVIVLQFFFFLAYAFASAEGRQQTGKPTPYSRNPDPYDKDYR